MSEDQNDDTAGYQRPPKSTRFAKGTSGNPAGRPRGRHRHAPYEAVLGQLVNVMEDGIKRRMTAENAFLIQLAKQGLEGDGVAARETLELIERAEREQSADDVSAFILTGPAPGSVNCALEVLSMAKRLDPLRETVRMALEPWLVQAALDRLHDPLTAAEQQVILKATRAPRKVKWPHWWTEYP